LTRGVKGGQARSPRVARPIAVPAFPDFVHAKI
jgi:hypothetical protein